MLQTYVAVLETDHSKTTMARTTLQEEETFTLQMAFVIKERKCGSTHVVVPASMCCQRCINELEQPRPHLLARISSSCMH